MPAGRMRARRLAGERRPLAREGAIEQIVKNIDPPPEYFTYISFTTWDDLDDRHAVAELKAAEGVC